MEAEPKGGSSSEKIPTTKSKLPPEGSWALLCFHWLLRISILILGWRDEGGEVGVDVGTGEAGRMTAEIDVATEEEKNRPCGITNSVQVVAPCPVFKCAQSLMSSDSSYCSVNSVEEIPDLVNDDAELSDAERFMGNTFPGNCCDQDVGDAYCIG